MPTPWMRPDGDGRNGESLPALQGVRGMLVAAGLGTRLAPLTNVLPKPAVPVGNRPVAAYMLAHFQAFGIVDVTVNLFHRAEELRRALLPYAGGARLRFVEEATLLGTGGGVKHALTPGPGEDVVVANAKLLFAPHLAAAMAHHRALSAIATMVVKPMPRRRSFSPVYVDADGRVRQILGPEPKGCVRTTMFTGVHILSAAAHSRLPAQGCAIRDGYLRWLEEGLTVGAVLDDGPFYDVGVDVAAYHDANMAVRDGRFFRPGLAPDARGNLICQGVEVPEGAQLTDCVIGPLVRIASNTVARRVVAWQGTELAGRLSDVIVTPTGVVPVAGDTS